MNILILDDIQYNLTLLSKVLFKLGHTVESCTTTNEAIRILTRSDIDAVLCDYQLGSENGIDFKTDCREKVYVQNGKTLPPFILFSAFSSEELESNAIKAGFIEYIKKPFSEAEVKQVLKRAQEMDLSDEEARKHTLIASDKPIIKQLIEKTISKQQVSVKWVTNVTEAINYYLQHPEITHIISDYHFNGYTAIDIFNLCKSNPTLSDGGIVNTPDFFVILSEEDNRTLEEQEEYKKMATEQGIKDVIWPPLSEMKLIKLFGLESKPRETSGEYIQKILVVDDCAFSRVIIANKLKKQGHTVIEASTGESALNILREDTNINLVIADLNLPDFNGNQLMTSLKKLKRYDLANKEVPCPPFILVTSATEDELNLSLVEEDDFYKIFYKPIELERLTTMSKDVLQQEMSKMWT